MDPPGQGHRLQGFLKWTQCQITGFDKTKNRPYGIWGDKNRSNWIGDAQKLAQFSLLFGDVVKISNLHKNLVL